MAVQVVQSSPAVQSSTIHPSPVQSRSDQSRSKVQFIPAPSMTNPFTLLSDMPSMTGRQERMRVRQIVRQTGAVQSCPVLSCPVCLTRRVIGVKSRKVAPPSKRSVLTLQGPSFSTQLPHCLVDHFIHRGLLVARAGDDVLVICRDVAAQDRGGFL